MYPASTVMGTEHLGVSKEDKAPVPTKVIFYDVRQTMKKNWLQKLVML